jgi:hypothetical protein
VNRLSQNIQSSRQTETSYKNVQSTTGNRGHPETQRTLLSTVKRFFSPARQASAAQRVGESVSNNATRSIKAEASSTRASTPMDEVLDAFLKAPPEGKNGHLLTAVRIAYRDVLTKSDWQEAAELGGKNHEMTVFMLNSKLSKLLSNQCITSDDLNYIEKSVPHFEGKLPDQIKDLLDSALNTHRQKTEPPKNQTMVATPGMYALQSPVSHERNADSERISGSAASLTKKTLMPEQEELRSQFAGKLRRSLDGTKAFPVEKVVAIAGTVLKELMLESQPTREIFSKKFEEATKKANFPPQVTELNQLQMLKYAEHAYDETIKPRLPH